MTHLVAPVSHRSGKTYLWRSNTLLQNTQKRNALNNNFILSHGLEKTIKQILNRQRYFFIKSTLSYLPYQNRIRCNVLFMPRIKTKPKSDYLGSFYKFLLYKNSSWDKTFIRKTKRYIYQRRLKIFKFKYRSIDQINKWLMRRMLRGSSAVKFKNKKKIIIKKRLKTTFFFWKT